MTGSLRSTHRRLPVELASWAGPVSLLGPHPITRDGRSCYMERDLRLLRGTFQREARTTVSDAHLAKGVCPITRYERQQADTPTEQILTSRAGSGARAAVLTGSTMNLNQPARVGVSSAKPLSAETPGVGFLHFSAWTRTVWEGRALGSTVVLHACGPRCVAFAGLVAQQRIGRHGKRRIGVAGVESEQMRFLPAPRVVGGRIEAFVDDPDVLDMTGRCSVVADLDVVRGTEAEFCHRVTSLLRRMVQGPYDNLTLPAVPAYASLGVAPSGGSERVLNPSCHPDGDGDRGSYRTVP